MSHSRLWSVYMCSVTMLLWLLFLLTCVQDSVGQSALHLSISCKQPQCSDLLLFHADLDLTIKDKAGNTPFAKAMAVKDDEAGRAILKREPKAAEQVSQYVCVWSMYGVCGACTAQCWHLVTMAQL